MDQVEQEFGKANPNAPAALSRFAFLIGRWRCEARVRLAHGEWQTLQATWLGRFILDGYAIADEYRMTGASGELIVLGMNLRTYDATKQTWNIKWLNVGWNMGGPWAGGARWSHIRWPIHHLRLQRAGGCPRLYPRHLHEHFPKSTSPGEVRSLTTGRRGANSWWSRSIVIHEIDNTKPFAIRGMVNERCNYKCMYCDCFRTGPRLGRVLAQPIYRLAGGIGSSTCLVGLSRNSQICAASAPRGASSKLDHRTFGAFLLSAKENQCALLAQIAHLRR
jgi:hypothetical protein